MKLRNRILLITSGVLIFLALAPTAIFFARGFRYDFTKHRVLKTGTLVIKTDPREVRVNLNSEKLKSHTPLTKRFLLPGEYLVELTNEGYRPWKKRITISEQSVTSLPLAREGKIALFLENLSPRLLATSTLDVLASNDQIYFLKGNAIYGLDQTAQNQNLVATTTDESLNPRLLPGAASEDLYYIAPDTRRLMLKNQNGPDTELISEILPPFKTSQIITTPGKQQFLLLDNDLYQVTETLQKINDSVKYASWNEDLPGLIYGNDHEVWIYYSDSLKSELVTRSSQTLGPGQYNKKTNFIFVAEENAIKAIEFDNLGQANVYTLAETSTPLPRFLVNNEGTDLTYLDGVELISLKIR